MHRIAIVDSMEWTPGSAFTFLCSPSSIHQKFTVSWHPFHPPTQALESDCIELFETRPAWRRQRRSRSLPDVSVSSAGPVYILKKESIFGHSVLPLLLLALPPTHALPLWQELLWTLCSPHALLFSFSITPPPHHWWLLCITLHGGIPSSSIPVPSTQLVVDLIYSALDSSS